MCSHCGTPHPEGAKFCAECGAAVAAVETQAEVRKVVTALFCDVTGSTALGESRDPETLRAVMTSYFAAMSDVLEHHGGTVEKFIGDAVMAVFGVPVVHEDDAARAVRAALQMQQRLRELNADLEARHGTTLTVRIGINTGEVVVGEPHDSTVAIGDAVNVAARLEQAAAPGEILIGAETWALVQGVVTAEPTPDLTVKGKTGLLRAWRVLSATGPDVARAMAASRLVGRDREMALLDQALERCVADRACQLTTIMGPPGVGKSRLTADFLDRVTDAVVLRGRCLSYGDTDGLWPLRDIVRAAAGLEGGESDAEGREALRRVLGPDHDPLIVEGLAPVAGYGGLAASVEETAWAFRRLVETCSRRAPWIVVIDDVHWATDRMLDVIEHVVDWSVDAPAMLLCLGRPELLDDRPHWGGGKVNATTMTLQPLTDRETGQLISGLLADIDLASAVGEQISAASGGLPLFVEQMIAMLAETGGSSGPLQVPPTVSALLAARLDLLAPDERSILEAAAVIGLVFYVKAIEEVTETDGRAVRSRIAGLVRKDFLHPADSDLPGEDAAEFRHVLVREAVYASLAKSRRADLHERIGRWLDKRSEERSGDFERFVVNHLATAVALRDDLGPRDVETGRLAREAIDRLAAEASRLDNFDKSAAIDLLDRAIGLGQSPEERLAPFIVRLRLAHTGDSEPAGLSDVLAVSELAAADAVAAGSERGARIVALHRRRLLSQAGEPPEELGFDLETAMHEFMAASDEEGIIASVWARLSDLEVSDHWDDMAPLAARLRAVATKLGDLDLLRQVVRLECGAVAWGSGDAAAGAALLEEMQARTTDPRSLVMLLFSRAPVLAMAGLGSQARAAIAEGDRIVDQFGLVALQAERSFMAGETELILGDGEAAEALLGPTNRTLEAQGEVGYRSTVLFMLAQARLLTGDSAGARAFAEQSRAIAQVEDIMGQTGWRLILSDLSLAEGDDETALSLAREALDRQLLGQQMIYRGMAYEAIGRALAAGDRPADARDAFRAASDCYQRRGWLAQVEAMRAELG